MYNDNSFSIERELIWIWHCRLKTHMEILFFAWRVYNGVSHASLYALLYIVFWEILQP